MVMGICAKVQLEHVHDVVTPIGRVVGTLSLPPDEPLASAFPRKSFNLDKNQNDLSYHWLYQSVFWTYTLLGNKLSQIQNWNFFKIMDAKICSLDSFHWIHIYLVLHINLLKVARRKEQQYFSPFFQTWGRVGKSWGRRVGEALKMCPDMQRALDHLWPMIT